MAGDTAIRHGTESYYVLGEGLLSESLGGRPADSPGTATADGTESASTTAADAPPFRFSRVGPKGRALTEAVQKKVAVAMTTGGGGTTGIPAGYTYLGQFIDHDLTFDKTKVMLGEEVSPADLLQGRSPSLDLDSLYGAGPQSSRSARFYKDDRHLKTGRTAAAGGDVARNGFDLPRVGAGDTVADKRKALIPDFRNDENLAVAQTHLAFIRFHNRVVDSLPASVPTAQRFARARQLVVKHYQWMIRHDFLPRICTDSILDNVFRNGRKIVEPDVSPTDVPTMPLEFSVAAYRLGHSMIRSAYDWNARFPSGQGTLDFMFTFSGTSGNLGGSLRLPSNWIADFRRLYNFKDAGRDDLAPPAGLNKAMRIDTELANPLRNLPTGSFGGPDVGFNDPIANLAFRNLARAAMVKLATGQQMVTMLKNRGVRVRALTKSQIINGSGGAKFDQLTAAQRDALATRTPLWLYILREAEFHDGKLAGVGGRIVAETFHRAMEGSRPSIVRDPDWRPHLGPNNSTFGMVDLLLFAFEGKKSLLAPLD